MLANCLLKKYGFLLPGTRGPRLYRLGHKTQFRKKLQLTLQVPSEHSCHLQLKFSPVTAVPCRVKVNPLRPRRSCFTPIRFAQFIQSKAYVVEVPGTAPGSDRFIAIFVYHHRWPEDQQIQHSGFLRRIKEGS